MGRLLVWNRRPLAGAHRGDELAAQGSTNAAPTSQVINFIGESAGCVSGLDLVRTTDFSSTHHLVRADSGTDSAPLTERISSRKP
jgi:hypothetical protein